jgi:DNA-binding NtrC family response regulator
MKKEFKSLNLHQKMEIMIKEMVDKGLPLHDSLKEFKRIYIEMATRKYKGNKTRIAKALGVHRNTLHNLNKTLKISSKN